MVKTVFVSFLLSTTALAAPLKLSQRDVAELILKQGPRTKEVTFLYDQYRYNLYKTYSLTDWKLLIESGYQYDRTESLASQGDYKYERYLTTASLSKQLLTGTLLSANVGRTSQKTNVISAVIPAQSDYNVWGVGLEQSIWGNAFGYGDRATFDQAEYTYKSTVILRTNELQNVVLDSLRQFWNTYVAQESFRQALASRERYEKLVTAVRRKTSLGYSAPGELSQVQAEYESRVQSVKSASSNYLAYLDGLITQLSLPPGTEIEFVVPKDVPVVPKLTGKPIDDLRIIRSQELAVKAANEGVTAANSREKPILNLVGRMGATGVEDTSSAAYAELASNTHPQYYAGVKLQYNFGSGVLSEDIRARKAAALLEQTKLERTRNEVRDNVANAERRVGATYAIAASSIQQREFRQKAAAELNRTYTQGRTDISTLIIAMNNAFDTEVSTVRALGDYYIALNAWAAARDELIPDQKEDNP